MEQHILGLPLEQAVELLRSQGIEPQIVRTAAPGDKREGTGTLRVIRVRGSELTVGDFHDSIKKA